MQKGELKKCWKIIVTAIGGLWYLLWKDDSWKGWIFSIIFLFVFIKFIFFPTLGLIAGTSLPLAIVESCSMYHEGNLFSNYDEWWLGQASKYEKFAINKLDFQDFIFKNGFNKGDILFMIKAKPEKLKIGDVIIFKGNQKTPLIHRIIEIKYQNGGYTFSTIGDNNAGQLTLPTSQIDERNISENQLIGKAVFKLAPYMGWGKLIWFEFAKKFDGNPNTNFEGKCQAK